MYQHKGSYSFFSIVRFVAAVIIAFFMHFHFHLRESLGLKSPFSGSRLLSFFSSGDTKYLVELFFIISGMLFVLVYLPRIAKGRYNFDSFMMHRIVRIYPMAMVTVLFLYAIQVALHRLGFGVWLGRGSTDLVSLFVDLFFGGKATFNVSSSNNLAIWYINVLMLCTTLAYGLGVLYARHPNKLLFALPLFFGLCLIYQKTNYLFFNLRVARGLVAFFLGCLLEFALQRLDDAPTPLKVFLCVLSALVLVFSVWLIIYHKGGYKSYISNLGLYCDFYLFPALICLFYHCRPLNALCEAKPIKFLGDISFDIYLWNFPIMGLFYLIIRLRGWETAFLQEHVMTLWWVLVGTQLVVAVLTHLLLEKPLTRYLVGILNAQTADAQDNGPKSKHLGT